MPETVINHIVLNRPDVAIIVVTEAPLSESWNPDGKPKLAITIYNRILKKLKKVRNHSKSIDIEAFLKHELGDDPSEWQKMYTYLQKGESRGRPLVFQFHIMPRKSRALKRDKAGRT